MDTFEKIVCLTDQHYLCRYIVITEKGKYIVCFVRGRGVFGLLGCGEYFLYKYTRTNPRISWVI
jgi:hypothetical protein